MSLVRSLSRRLPVALTWAVVTCAAITTGSAGAAQSLWPYGVTPHSDIPPQTAPASAGVTALQRRLDSDLNRQGGANSALVIDETTDQTLWAYNDRTARIPASVEKLWTTTAALLDFGADATLQTNLLGVGTLTSGGTFIGTLYLRGDGDPTFGSGTFDHIMYDAGATVQTLAANLRSAGVRRVQGMIVGDDSHLDRLRGGPATRFHASLDTEGTLGGLTYDAGFTNLHEDALDTDPALVAVQAFADELPVKGITLAKGTRIRTGVAPSDARLLASVASPTLAKLLLLTNSPSDNFFAETLVKDLGAQFAHHGTTEAGAEIVRSEIASNIGVHPQLDDGSGLSRYDRSNVRQVVLLLREMQNQPPFWNSLAIAGVRGTMVHEMRRTRAANNCRGKTGTLRDVANLVGYCRAANGDHLVFAFMMNGLGSSTAGHELEDLAAEALANYRG